MKKWIRIISMVLAMVMTLQCLPVRTSAAQTVTEDASGNTAVQTQLQPETGPVPESEPIPTTEPYEPPSGTAGDLTWTLEEGVLTISGTGGMPNYSSYDRPAWYDYRSEVTSVVIEAGVTSVGNYAFQGFGELTAVTLPEGVTRLGRYAFYNCSALGSVSMPDTLTQLDLYAFQYCTGLKSVRFSESLTEIPDYAFNNCTSLENLEIPASVATIGDYAFQYCSALKSLMLHEGVTRIDIQAFGYCTALEEITLPNSLTTINTGAFSNCKALTAAALPDSITYLGQYLFSSCTSLREVRLPADYATIPAGLFDGCAALDGVQIPETVTSIGVEAFRGCASLTEIVIPDGVSNISNSTFLNCSALTDVTLPRSLYYIGDYAFKSCTALKRIEMPDTVNSLGKSVFSDCTALETIHISEGLTSMGANTFLRCSSLSSAVIPEGVVQIPDNTFNGCSSLESVSLPDTVTSLGSCAFCECVSLREVRLPASLVYMGSNAFARCPITEIVFPEGLTTIGEYAFVDCTALQSAVLPDTVTSVGAYAFSGCSALREAVLSQGMTSVANNLFFNCHAMESLTMGDSITTIGSNAFANCTSLLEVDLPEALTTIGQRAFENCKSIRTVTMHDSLTQIGSSAFLYCISLESVVLPDSVTTLGSQVFNGCNRMTRVTLSENLTELPERTFYQCYALEAIAIPASVTEIGSSAFDGCSALAELELTDGLTTIGSYAFLGCHALEQVRLPDTVTTVEPGAFASCSGLQEVRLSDGMTAIDSYTFQDCTALRRIDIPASVTTIGYCAFDGCSDLREVYITDRVTYIDYSAFTVTELLAFYGYPGSYAETYANQRGIPFFDIQNPPVTLVLTLTDEEGSPLTEGYEVAWYRQGEAEPVAAGTSLRVTDLASGYRYAVTLGEMLSYRYYQPDPVSVPADTDGDLTLALEPITTVTVTGQVTDREGSGLPASITLTQTYNQRYTKTRTFETNADGSYTLTVDNVPTEAIITGPDGYFVFRRTLLKDRTDAGAVDAGVSALYPLPAGDRIGLTLLCSAAGESGPEEAVTMTGTADLAFTVYDRTRSTWLDTPVFQGGYLYLSGDFGVGDTLTVSVTDRSGRYAGQSVHVRLGDGCTASAELTLVENGCIRINGLGGVERTRVLVFDEGGTLLGSGTASAGYASGPLPEGSYRLILMEQNPYIVSADDPALLTRLGLEEGTDYLLLEANVQTGVITGLTGLQTPMLDLSRLRHTVESATYVSVSQIETTQGQYVMVQLSYELEADYGQSATGETVLIDLPAGLTTVERAVSVDGRAADYTVSDGRITVRTGTDAARIAFYVLTQELGVQSITASLQSEEGGLTRLEPLGSGVINVTPARLSAPAQTNRKTVTVRGIAAPDSIVRVCEDGSLLAQTTANAAGSWMAEVTLSNLLSYQVHDLYAVIEHEQFDKPITTESARIVYDSAMLPVRRVIMYNGLGGGIRDTIFSYEGGWSARSYSWSPDYPNFTFVIEFDGDNTAADNVKLAVYTATGDRDVYDAVYSEARGAWVTGARYDNAAELPVNVGVIYDSNVEAVHGLTVEGTAAFEAYDAASREFMESQLTVGEPQTVGDSHVLPLVLEGFPELTRDMTLTELALESYDPAVLESQGYTLFDPDETGAQTYIKLDIADGTMTLWLADVQEQYALSITTPAEFIEPEQAEALNAASILLLETDAEWEALQKTLGEYADLIGIVPGYQDLISVIYHYKTRDRLIADMHEKMAELYRLMYAACPNGDPMVDNQDYWWEELRFWEGQILATNARWNLQLRKCSEQITNNFIKDLLFKGCGKLAEKLGKLGKLSETNQERAEKILDLLAKLDGLADLGSMVQGSMGSGVLADMLAKYDDLFGADPDGVYQNMLKEYDTMMDTLNDLHDQMISDVKCEPPEDEDEDKCPEPDKVPQIDPAGYVYEAVASNRLEGVTVTAYYQTDESLGPASATKWDAENYDQVNPLTTDADGRYAWFVPFGQWAVKFELEGYETAWSEWLPVPPPQMEVNMGLVSTAAPEVESVNVYPDQIRIIFSQYMKPDTVALAVSSGGSRVTGRLEPVNAEYEPTGTEQYATIFRFVPDGPLSGSVTVGVSGAVNYAGTAMTAGYTVTKQTAVRPEEIVMAAKSSLVFGETLEIPVRVLPAEAGADRTLTVTTNAPGLLDAARQSVTTDAEGNAVITVIGTLPTTAELTVRLDGTDLEATGTVRVLLRKEEPCETVTASIPNGSTVAPGTLLELYTATEGAEIYYTLDGTCPCVEDSPSRIWYDGPIPLNEDTFLIAYAVKEGFEDSPTAGFIYTVCTHSDTLLENDRKATCTADGYTGDVICDDCGTLVEQGSVIPAPGHSWDEGVVTQEPTEDAPGEKLYTCTACRETRTEVLPELGHEHSYDALVTEPTCTEPGFTTHTCRCGDSYTDSHTDALGHNMGQWYTVQEMTCTSDGLERRECSRCDYDEEHTIEAPGHDYESVVTEPTCTKGGYTVHTCRNCGASYKDRYTNATGHDHVAVVTEPTCTEPGFITHTCHCGDSYVGGHTDALGHSFGQWIAAENGMEERVCERCGFAEQRPAAGPVNPFTDVPEKSWYTAPVLWAVENGITNGLTATTFGPTAVCNRAQVVTFLWRAAGSPEPETTTHNFVDVAKGSFYEKAVLWAVEKGITTGSDATHFDPTGDCNRAQVVTFLYRTFGSPAVETTDNPFTDVPEKSWYTAPVLWAVENGITNGLTAATFGPTAVCNRAQVVTFLYRAFAD